MATLSAKGRKQVKKGNFASPKGVGDAKDTDAYPIQDKEHAASALARVKQHGSPAEQARVKKAVCTKFPDLPACQTDRNAAMNSAIRKGAGR